MVLKKHSGRSKVIQGDQIAKLTDSIYCAPLNQESLTTHNRNTSTYGPSTKSRDYPVAMGTKGESFPSESSRVVLPGTVRFIWNHLIDAVHLRRRAEVTQPFAPVPSVVVVPAHLVVTQPPHLCKPQAIEMAKRLSFVSCEVRVSLPPVD